MRLLARLFRPQVTAHAHCDLAFWLLMQVGMMVGYSTSWPANVWLIKRGIKVAM